jgi:hypothetical protein
MKRCWPRCRWCGKDRGVVIVESKNSEPYGVLFCPRCDFAHDHAAGPPIEHRIRDVYPKP